MSSIAAISHACSRLKTLIDIVLSIQGFRLDLATNAFDDTDPDEAPQAVEKPQKDCGSLAKR